MERLTNKSWRNLDPWECCGQDKYCKRGCHDEGGCNNGCIVPKLYSRLARYEDAEEQGRLIVLPCKVGDTVWFIRPLEQKPKIEEAIVEKIGVRKRGMYLKLSCNSVYETAASSIGKSVFLSREEAEKALEGEANK